MSTFNNDFAKAVKGNANGAVKGVLNSDAEWAASRLGALQKAAADNDFAAIVQAAPVAVRAIGDFLPKLDNVLQQLLEARIAGFHATVFWRLLVSLLFVGLGLVAAALVVRSISAPINKHIETLGLIQSGRFDVELPGSTRRDEIGRLFQAAEQYRQAAAQAAETQRADRDRHASEAVRLSRLNEKSSSFSALVHDAVTTLKGNLGKADQGATQIASDADRVANQASVIAAASEQAACNVQTVAQAAEELAASINAIVQLIGQASEIAEAASRESREARLLVQNLSQATSKIGR